MMEETKIEAETKTLSSLIKERKNIFLFPGLDNQEDSLLASLALFSSLKNSGQKANLILGSLPWETQPFTSESFSSQPKIIIRPPASHQIRQLRYEKKQEQLIFYLDTQDETLDRRDFDFLFSPQPQPDLLITLGIQKKEKVVHPLFRDFQDSLPIINIAHQASNQQFGQLNLVSARAVSLSHWLTIILRQLQKEEIDAQTAGYLLQGLKLLPPEKQTKESLAEMHYLIGKGALEFNLPSSFLDSQAKIDFLQSAIKKIQFSSQPEVAFLPLENGVWFSFSPPYLSLLLRELKSGLFRFKNILLLWKVGPQSFQGIITLQDQEKQKRVLKTFSGKEKGKTGIFRANKTNLSSIKSKIWPLLTEKTTINTKNNG